jgi:AhpD family alkylhydroperoxidase
MHSSCPVTGRVFNVGTGRVAEVFSGVTAGYVSKGHLTPEEVRDNFDQVVDRTDFNVPIDMGDHGSWVRQVLAERRDDAWEEPGTLHRALVRAPSVSVAQRSLRRQIVRGLDQRAVEVVVLRHAAATANAYCWEQHRRPATEAGITLEQIRAIASADRDALSDDDRLMVELVDGVLEQNLADDVRDEVTQKFGAEQLVQLVMLVGYSSMIGQAGRGLAIEATSE